MKVLLDDQIMSTQRDGGISRYFVELMLAYRSNPSLGVEVTTPKIWTQNRYLVESGMGRRVPPPLDRGTIIRLANRRQRFRHTSDVVHHTYYFGEYLGRLPQDTLRVVTVYDMIPELLPEEFPSGNPHRDKRAFVDAADLILCISDATRRDLVNVYGMPAAPMVVTPLGVAEAFHPGMQRSPRLPESYVLFVGARGSYKDFDVLAEAFAGSGVSKDVWLVAAGGGLLSDQEQTRLDEMGISERVLQVVLTDAELASAYANAACFVYPSRYEGFGLPTLEAMASGCLTILAESSAHVEVGGDAALFFPPGDIAELSRLLGEALSPDDPHTAKRQAGLVQAARFTWQKTARLTADAYRDFGTER